MPPAVSSNPVLVKEAAVILIVPPVAAGVPATMVPLLVSVDVLIVSVPPIPLRVPPANPIPIVP